VAQSAPDCPSVTYNGSGTVSDPYEAGEVDELQCIEEESLDANYTQVSDIDVSETSLWNNGKGFEPIGELGGKNFTGTFDGNGYNITNLTIHHRNGEGVGLFGLILSPGKVTNVSVTNADIYGYRIVGAVVGGSSGNVSDSYASGNVNGTGNRIGGLAGENVGNVSGSHATSNVSGDNVVGGFVGINFGNISDSHATGNVNRSERYVGGLVGRNDGNISDSYATGNASGYNDVGSLVGGNFGDTSYSYATGNADGRLIIGGLAGFNHGEISYSHATGNVNGDHDLGGSD